MGERIPPHDIGAEEAVLGSILIDGEAIFKVLPFLKPDDFYREKNRWVYEACISLFERDEPIDQIMVAEELSRRGKFEAIGGMEYIKHLIDRTPTSLNIEEYGEIVHRLGVMRRLIKCAEKIADIGYESPPDIDSALSRAEALLYGLRYGEERKDFLHLRDILDKYFEESGFVPRRDGYLPHVPTGFSDLDKLLGGLQRSDMIVLAARPSLGKTSLALNIARNAAIEHGARVGIFSLEMSRTELAYRFISSESGVDTQRLRIDQLTDSQREAVMEAMGILAEAEIYIDDSPSLQDAEMRARAKRLHNEKPLDLLIIDYIQLMKSSRRIEGRVQEMTEISRSIKELARELNIPVIAVSQLSRAPETRADHRPLLSDLRESGSIEQDADVVIFIHRDDFYYTKEEWERKFPDKPYPKGIARIIVAKHRNGPTGEVPLIFKERFAKFEDVREEKRLL